MSFKTLMSVLFPAKCAACGRYLDSPAALCDECATELKRTEPPYCPYCFRGVEFCRCRKLPRAYDGAVAPFYYEGAAKDAVRRMKFHGKESSAVFLGRELGREINVRYFGIHFDILTCVPLAADRMAERGFNQSRSIAENLNLDPEIFSDIIPDYNLLIRKSQAGDRTQHSLGAESRRRNIENAYTLNKNRNITGKTILLIDDVLTTGATAEACARVLKLNGARKVYVATAVITRVKTPDEKNSRKIPQNVI